MEIKDKNRGEVTKLKSHEMPWSAIMTYSQAEGRGFESRFPLQ